MTSQLMQLLLLPLEEQPQPTHTLHKGDATGHTYQSRFCLNLLKKREAAVA